MSDGRPSTVLRGVGVHAERVRLGGVPLQGGGGLAPAVPSLQPAPAERDAQTLETLREEARRQGYEEGLREGQTAARQRVDAELAQQKDCHEHALQEAVTRLQREQAQAAEQQRQRVEALCLALRQQVDVRLQELEQQAVELAFLSLQKILGAGPQRIEAMRTLVEEQVAALRAAGPLQVHLHPADLALLQHAGDGRTQDEGLQWVADPRLPVGGCVIQSGRGRLDIGLPGQLARLGQAWLEWTAAS